MSDSLLTDQPPGDAPPEIAAATADGPFGEAASAPALDSFDGPPSAPDAPGTPVASAPAMDNFDGPPSAPAGPSAPAAPAMDNFDPSPAPFAPAAPADSADLLRLSDVPMELSVEIGRTRMTVGETLQLSAGSIVTLERLAGEPVDLLVNGTPIARGEVVIVDEQFGLRVTEIIEGGRAAAASEEPSAANGPAATE
jgi:flagellar motor switch protein FliN